MSRVVSQSGQKFVLITGLPRSGTTLLCNILNSAENAAVLSEPRNCIRHNGFMWPDKLGHKGCKVKMFPEEIPPFLKQHGSKPELVGVKEVFQEWAPDKMLCDYAIFEADLILVTLRDPIDTYSSQKRRFGMSLGPGLIHMAKFIQWVDEQAKVYDLRFVDYKGLCADPVGEINRAADGHFQMTGPLEMKPMEGFGDGRALSSASIQEAVVCPPLEAGEALAISAVAGDWFSAKLG